MARVLVRKVREVLANSILKCVLKLCLSCHRFSGSRADRELLANRIPKSRFGNHRILFNKVYTRFVLGLRIHVLYAFNPIVNLK